jgi:hypothetical protein
MAVGDVVLFDVVATLGGGFSATLAAGPSTLCVGSSILVAGWFVRMLVSCHIALTCFAFTVADDGIFLPSAVRRSVAARMGRSCCDAIGIWQWVG